MLYWKDVKDKKMVQNWAIEFFKFFSLLYLEEICSYSIFYKHFKDKNTIDNALFFLNMYLKFWMSLRKPKLFTHFVDIKLGNM